MLKKRVIYIFLSLTTNMVVLWYTVYEKADIVYFTTIYYEDIYQQECNMSEATGKII